MAPPRARLLAPVALLVQLVNAVCYHPNGTANDAPNLFACGNGKEFTNCCVRGDECTTNGLCKGGGDARLNWFWRESCTDSSWKADECPHHCHIADIDPTAPTRDWIVLQCSPTTYCCSYLTDHRDVTNSTECCQDQARLFDAGPVVYQAGNIVLPASVPKTSSSSSTSTSGPTSSTSSPPSATSNTSENPQASGLSSGAIAGIAVGAVAAVTLLVVALYLVWRARQRKQREAESESMAQPPPPWYPGASSMEPKYQQPTMHHELQSSGYGHSAELPGPMHFPRYELSGQSPPSEVPGQQSYKPR